MALRLASNAFLRRSGELGTIAAPLAARALSTTLDRAQSKEDYERVLATFATVRACAVLRTATSAACPKAMHGCIDGGFKIVRVRVRTPPECLDHLSNFKKEYDRDVMAGCGTIMDRKDA